MEKLLVYSFRTNKHIVAFKEAEIDVFVLGKLKEDMAKLVELIEKRQPARVIGVAEIKTKSRFESVAINSFGPKGKVNRRGKKSYALYIPKSPIFHVSKIPTRSFCNWAMYKVSEAIGSRGVRHSFVHFNRGDIPALIKDIMSACKENP
ncbi:MAG TPA: hypothetical protein VGE35_02190 [Candidatus Paceibacterota bacterium]